MEKRREGTENGWREEDILIYMSVSWLHVREGKRVRRGREEGERGAGEWLEEGVTKFIFWKDICSVLRVSGMVFVAADNVY